MTRKKKSKNTKYKYGSNLHKYNRKKKKEERIAPKIRELEKKMNTTTSKAP
jgi:hypothetical protein